MLEELDWRVSKPSFFFFGFLVGKAEAQKELYAY